MYRGAVSRRCIAALYRGVYRGAVSQRTIPAHHPRRTFYSILFYRAPEWRSKQPAPPVVCPAIPGRRQRAHLSRGPSKEGVASKELSSASFLGSWIVFWEDGGVERHVSAP
jgi:hypothetical protein